MNCEICNRECKNLISLSKHIRIHNIDSKYYYDKYLKKEGEDFCTICNQKTNFLNILKGYRKLCSCVCVHEFNKIKKIKYFNDKIKNLNIILLDKNYINNKYKHNWKCLKCRYEFIRNFNNIKNNQKCPICYPNEIKKPINLYEKINMLNLKLLNDYKNEHFKHNWKCLKCRYEFEQEWNKIQQGYMCPKCYPRNQGYSNLEKELCDFVKLIEQSEIIENSKDIISPYELDILIPSKNIAIEVNGLYWHSEKQGKDKYYHLNKTNECLKQNIKLIHIFEDEWIFKQDIVKSRLRQILGINNSKRIHARECEIKEIYPKIKNEFLNKYHIQGGDNSNIKLGSFYNGELVSVMTFSKGNISKGSKSKDYIYELNRFCSNSNYHIPGIASKLLSHFQRNYEWKEIFSYTDRRWSTGNVYYKLGFELDHITKPNYWYVKNQVRIHRFNLRKLTDEPKDIPEWILRQKEGYYRIWDCGHYKFRINKIK